MFDYKSESLAWSITAENAEMREEELRMQLAACGVAAKRFLSIEPLLGQVDIDRYLPSSYEKAAHDSQMLGTECQSDKIDWVASLTKLIGS